MVRVASVGHLDAITSVEKLRDQLPAGSAQNYAAILVLNYLDSYSKQYGLRIEDPDRLAVTALSLEFLYMAWYNDVGIELSERQLGSWPPHVWKNSANLGIDLHSLVKHPNPRSMHNQLRDVRTLLSFGAMVNQYHELIQFQVGGLEAFIRTYQPVEPEELEPPPHSPSHTPPSPPEIHSKGSSNKTNDLGWNWLPWGNDKTPKNQPSAPVSRLKIPGSLPAPPAEVIPLYITGSTVHFHVVPHAANSSTSLSRARFHPLAQVKALQQLGSTLWNAWKHTSACLGPHNVTQLNFCK